MLDIGLAHRAEESMKRGILMGCCAAALLASGLAIVPRGWEGAQLLLGPRDEVAVTQYVLAGKQASDYQAVTEQALAARDEDLAASIAALAERKGVVLPGDLHARISAAQEEARDRMGADAWNGFHLGNAKNEAELAGAVAADLTGIGDIRDLYEQATKYLNGEEIDGLTVGIAAAGLGLTAATVATLGLTLPKRAGLSALKAVKQAGRLSPALARDVGMTASSAIDGAALKTVSTSLARFDVAAAQEAAGRVVNPAALRALKGLGADAATIGQNAGYRATVQTLGTASRAEDVTRVARLSGHFGTATRGVLALGGAAFTFASLAASAAFWSVSLLFWCGAALLWISGIGHRIGRWIWPKRQAGLQPA